ALQMKVNDKEEYCPYSYYANFLARTGNYLEAEDYIRKIEILSVEASEFFKAAYKADAMGCRVIYYLSIGDYLSYIHAAETQYDHIAKTNTYKYPCDPYVGIRLTTAAYAREMLKDYNKAEQLWKSRDSANYIWVNCNNKTYPNNPYYPISIYPVFLAKRGKLNKLPKPVSFYINETEAHYKSYSQYADFSINFMKADQLGFLGSRDYPALFSPLLDRVKNNRDFRESTIPFVHYAWFCTRDRKWEEAARTCAELFNLNTGWINDVIFTFGEKAFVTYYNSKLKEGYENFHSFVKMAKEKQPDLFPQLAGQDYNNLLFTKSISLKGTEKRKEAFLRTNDSSVTRLYNEWILKKEALIRQYMKSDDPIRADSVDKVKPEEIRKLQDQVDRLENELTDKSKDFKKYLRIDPPDWKKIRDQLKEGEAAVEMVRFNWRDQLYYSDTAYYAAYIITRSSTSPDVVYLTDDATELDDKYYKTYKTNISLKKDDLVSYDHFWKPIQSRLQGIRKIYFSPDGIYHLLNVSTLKDPGTGKWLLDELQIQYTVSVSDMGGQVKEDQKIGNAVLIGRPLYKTGIVNTNVPVESATRSFVRNFKDREVPDLPGTETEIVAIKNELEADKVAVRSYLKEKATEDEIYKLHSPGILHIATHGYWSPAGENATEGYRLFNAMVNSGLLLAGVVDFYNKPDLPDTYDGILTAYEAQNLDLQNTTLVILSACETNLGYLDAGEGVYGLQRAFRAAGASSIMTSLWKIDDNATKDFMIAFYHQFLLTNDKWLAFTQAQKTIKEKYHDPFYWG
ncbi:MAG TPA: CHAT domain-containing protein, partial [Chitinophagaceae bacterium]|nr:CHAT domain-containing protein [Chitinophagaceae bacterium]